MFGWLFGKGGKPKIEMNPNDPRYKDLYQAFDTIKGLKGVKGASDVPKKNFVAREPPNYNANPANKPNLETLSNTPSDTPIEKCMFTRSVPPKPGMPWYDRYATAVLLGTAIGLSCVGAYGIMDYMGHRNSTKPSNYTPTVIEQPITSTNTIPITIEKQPEVISDTVKIEKQPEVISDTVKIEKQPEVISDTVKIEKQPEVISDTVKIEKQPEVVSNTQTAEEQPKKWEYFSSVVGGGNNSADYNRNFWGADLRVKSPEKDGIESRVRVGADESKKEWELNSSSRFVGPASYNKSSNEIGSEENNQSVALLDVDKKNIIKDVDLKSGISIKHHKIKGNQRILEDIVFDDPALSRLRSLTSVESEVTNDETDAHLEAGWNINKKSKLGGIVKVDNLKVKYNAKVNGADVIEGDDLYKMNSFGAFFKNSDNNYTFDLFALKRTGKDIKIAEEKKSDYNADFIYNWDITAGFGARRFDGEKGYSFTFAFGGNDQERMNAVSNIFENKNQSWLYPEGLEEQRFSDFGRSFSSSSNVTSIYLEKGENRDLAGGLFFNLHKDLCMNLTYECEDSVKRFGIGPRFSYGTSYIEFNYTKPINNVGSEESEGTYWFGGGTKF